MPISASTLNIFAGSAEFWIPLKVAAGTRPGDYEVKIQAYYQVCDDKQCLPPHGEPVPFKIKVLAGAAADAGAPAQSPGTPPAPAMAASTDAQTALPAGTAAEVEKARSSGFLPFLWLSMTMGALSLATPCVSR